MRILYTDRSGVTAERTIWPIMIGFVESQRLIAAWCDLHQKFGVFRADGIQDAGILDEGYPGNRRQLAKEWRSRFCPKRPLIESAE